jgi:hypothetical protein
VSHGSRRGVLRTLGAFLVVATWGSGLGSGGSGVAGPAAARAATPDLTLVTDAHYEVLPAQASVAVSVDITATNHLVDTAANRYFFEQAYLAVQPGASGFALTAPGLRPKVSVAASEPTHTLLLLRFGTRLAAGATLGLRLTFLLADPGAPPDRDVRVGDTLVTFSAWAFASDSTPGSSVSVSLPAPYEVTFLRGTLDGPMPEADGRQTFASGPLDAPTTFEATIRATRATTFVDSNRSTTVGHTTARVQFRGWRDDPAWMDQASRLVLAGAPALSTAIGLPWPVSEPLDVEEGLVAEASISAGRFDPRDPRIEIAYYAGPEVVLHELAHTWFNGGLLQDRWANEAFASLYAEQAAAALGEPLGSPELTPELEASKLPLNAWGLPGEAPPAVEAYGYAASLDLARAIAARAGADGLAGVWTAIERGDVAYGQASGAESPADWRTLLDLLEERTGLNFSDLWLADVVRPEEAGLIYARASARREYASLVTASGDWTVPATIRASMRAWQFDAARASMAKATETIAARDRLRQAAAAAGLATPESGEVAFAGGQLDVAAADIGAAQSAAGAIAAAGRARPADPGPLAELGLLGTDPAAALRSARAAFEAGDSATAYAAAADAEMAWRTAEDVGRGRIFGSLAGALAVVLLIRLVTSRGWARQVGWS